MPIPVTPLQPKDGRPAIRMFCHALGDCFLIGLPHGQEIVYLAIDCGAIIGTPDSSARIQEAAQGLLDSCQGKLNHLAVTHEHWDHVSGFLDAEEIWKKIAIETLHYAWTEDETDELANSIRDQRDRSAEVALTALQKMTEDQKGRTLGLLGFLGVAEEGEKIGKTRQGLIKPREWVKKDNVKYWHPGQTFQISENIRLAFLGPPHDEKALKKTSKKNQQYALAMNEMLLGGMEMMFGMNSKGVDPDTSAPAGLPFLREGIPFEDVPKEFEGDEKILAIYKSYTDAQYRRIDHDWLKSVESLALAMDSATNNTSLAFALHLEDTDEYLLFVADAQAGNWLSWGNQTYKVKVDGVEKDVTIDEIFAKTIFYKVGHHGSHNATMSHEGLEKMTNDKLAAMIPVDTFIAHEKKGWTEMPLEALVDRLRQKTQGRLMLLDDSADSCPPGFVRGPKSDLLNRQIYLDYYS